MYLGFHFEQDVGKIRRDIQPNLTVKLVVPLFRILEVLVLNLSTETSYPDIFLEFPQFLQSGLWIGPQIRPQFFKFTNLLVFDAVA
jgi:hypothetical protein